MSPAISTTSWRDQPIVPSDYENLSSLIETARKARHVLVEFDWVFTRDDLQRLRRGVYEWGSSVVGRYKCFDARVLAAINEGLGDTDSIFVLTEPKNSRSTDCRVACVSDADVFRLRGHAPFDIVFGYGSAGIGHDAQLGSAVQKTLADAVNLLNWDLQRLHEKRFRPVRNALYGLPLDHGVSREATATGPLLDVDVRFSGPFSALGDGGCRCVFTDEMARRRGIYLWTISVEDKDRPWYVGQTRRGFGQRMGEHLAGFLSGEYTAYDAAALSRGEYRRAHGAVEGPWPQTLPSFLQTCESVIPNITALIRLIRFHLAPLDGDKHLLDRVEGAIGRHYRRHEDAALREFFAPGIKLPPRISGDRPVRVRLSSEVPLAGLPAEIREE